MQHDGTLEVSMFYETKGESRRTHTTRVISIAAHCVILLLMLRSPKAIFVKPSGTQYGKHGTATQLVYLPRAGADPVNASPDSSPKKLSFPKPRPKVRPTEVAKESTPTPAGSPSGSLFSGPLTGHEVRPAFPIVFPDPVVSRSEIPSGMAGDVIIEVTIDERGVVTATKVLQPFGYGIEDKVLAVVRNWRFTPATMDGVAIPSQQDVHFHFPS